MAQYGDPNNSDLSRFQRYNPGAESSAQDQGTNGHGANGYGNGAGTPVRNEGSQPASGDFSQGQDGLDPTWFQRQSSTTRKRNQWRQFQSLRPDFGPAADPLNEPTSTPSPAPRNTSLPSFPAAQRPALPAAPTTPQGRLPSPEVRPPAWRPQPSVPPQGGAYSSPLQAPGTGQSRVSHLEFKSSSGASAGLPPLHPHPHSTALPEPAPLPRRSPPGSTAAGSSTKVTPLRPAGARRSLTSRTPAGSSAPAPALGERPALASASGGDLRSRVPAKPRRRLAKPPLPLLYLIRLIILGVGVAAIAGTLLSVLSPSNLASSSGGQDGNAQEAASGQATGSLVAGTTASLVNDVALGQELTRLQAEVQQLATLTPGLTQTAFMLDLDTGDYVDITGTQPIAAASTIKMPILVAFLQQVDAGNIALNQGLVLQETQVAGGSGKMQNDAVGTRYTALEVATQMIITSDNTATNIMIDALGGANLLNQQFQAWGLEATVLRNPLPDLDGTNTTTTKDLTLLMALVDQGGILTPRSRDRMFSIMQRTVNRSLLPFGITDGSLIANKTGDISTVLGDVALVDAPNGKRYALATLVERPNNDGRASELIRRTAEAVHKEFSQPIAPVGGLDPSVPEDSVPAPASPEDAPGEPGLSPNGTLEQPQESSPNREQIPQG